MSSRSSLLSASPEYQVGQEVLIYVPAHPDKVGLGRISHICKKPGLEHLGYFYTLVTGYHYIWEDSLLREVPSFLYAYEENIILAIS